MNARRLKYTAGSVISLAGIFPVLSLSQTAGIITY
jgi:hypothetical protein